MKVLACIVLALVAVACATEPEKRAVVYSYPVASAYSAGYVAPVAPIPYSNVVSAKFGTPASTIPVTNYGIPVAYHPVGYY